VADGQFGKLIGYARTSTIEQEAGLAAQVVELEAAGCAKVFAERRIVPPR
jgi:DNA invertase Pin-like site-specific DNA recombinase